MLGLQRNTSIQLLRYRICRGSNISVSGHPYYLDCQRESRLLTSTPWVFSRNPLKSSLCTLKSLRVATRWKHTSVKTNSKMSFKRQNTSVVLYVASVIVFFTGISYAFVPLYKAFCQMTGFAGTPRLSSDKDNPLHQKHDNLVPHPLRPLRITFNADVNPQLPWKFRPQQKEIIVSPGETALAFYSAENYSEDDIVGISTYNVLPDKAAQYFTKIQCFCFEDQRLKAGEQVDMPVLFFIDPKFLDDPDMNDVKTLTLSYTFFRSKDIDSPVARPNIHLPSTTLIELKY